jgi:hypothetical protein
VTERVSRGFATTLLAWYSIEEPLLSEAALKYENRGGDIGFEGRGKLCHKHHTSSDILPLERPFEIS